MEKDLSSLESQKPLEDILEFGKWSTVKAIRDANLKATDWYVTKSQETGEVLTEEFKSYRQALRDIPQTYTNPDEVVWPVKPVM
ncbi:hypothetical protein PCIT_a2937 [Pseudoalteromonas citrea]|uniref:Phage tail assembly chaperone-like domain-containing protein n=2 Tax=Pseudoalteromonas citrea TaxID=43655 RepID=A0AAD4AI03_9GAMM|nr:tail fiber assembly protein [Pseudoalteromonas citrea]KAF7770001.1 hypothetical protein PCIT_a2937 [Pseudoalteromonas citrea]